VCAARRLRLSRECGTAQAIRHRLYGGGLAKRTNTPAKCSAHEATARAQCTRAE
jgi:hypothetical protein